MRVAIIGGLAQPENFNQDDYDEVWGMNSMRQPWVKQWHRRFQLHGLAHLRREWKDGLDALAAWLNSHHAVMLYTLDEWPASLAPNQRLFPLEELVDTNPRSRYHCCSTDWLIAYAIHQGATKIGLHGIPCGPHNDHPISSRACVEYWCGVATGRGIDVTATDDCVLFSYLHLVKSNSVYGLDSVPLIEDRTNEFQLRGLLNDEDRCNHSGQTQKHTPARQGALASAHGANGGRGMPLPLPADSRN